VVNLNSPIGVKNNRYEESRAIDNCHRYKSLIHESVNGARETLNLLANTNNKSDEKDDLECNK
jgi:hypothetical protein